MNEIGRFFIETILGELVVVILGVLFANYIWSWMERRRFGDWRVIVQRQGEELVRREISPRKVREVLEEPVDLVTFLKGVVSPYAFINCDLITEGQKRRLLLIDRPGRRFVLNLDQNPPGTVGDVPHQAQRRL